MNFNKVAQQLDTHMTVLTSLAKYLQGEQARLMKVLRLLVEFFCSSQTPQSSLLSPCKCTLSTFILGCEAGPYWQNGFAKVWQAGVLGRPVSAVWPSMPCSSGGVSAAMIYAKPRPKASSRSAGASLMWAVRPLWQATVSGRHGSVHDDMDVR